MICPHKETKDFHTQGPPITIFTWLHLTANDPFCPGGYKHMYSLGSQFFTCLKVILGLSLAPNI